MSITHIGFDADDTLWHNETYFAATQAHFRQLLSHYHEPEWIDQKLYETEMRNLSHFGYGVKGFTLSMIETAIELTEGRIHGSEVMSILDAGKQMLKAPIELLDHVANVVSELAKSYPLLLITKGDLMAQETKIAGSGLASYFTHIEIVSEKSPEIYGSLLERYEIEASSFLMIGNSMRSDVLPVLEIGGFGVHLPFQITWTHEQVPDEPLQSDCFFRLKALDELPELVRHINQS